MLALRALRVMADLTGDQLRGMLRSKGEEPPRSWTKVELRMRLEEMTGEDMTSKEPLKSDKSAYEKLVVQLNAASRRKADLIGYCRGQLKMGNLDSFTIPRIQQMAT